MIFFQYVEKEDGSQYHNFFHKMENRTFHMQLSIEMIKYLSSYICNEFTEFCEKGALYLENPPAFTDFILYGQLSLWIDSEDKNITYKERSIQIQKYITTLLGIN